MNLNERDLLKKNNRGKKKGNFAGLAAKILLDDFACCETWTNGVDLYLYLVARFGLWDKDYKAFDPCDSVTATASLFDLNFVLLAFLYWLVEGAFKAHAFHLDFSFS